MFVGDPWIWIWVRGAKSLASRRDFGAGEFWRNARIDEIFPREGTLNGIFLGPYHTKAT